MRFARPLIQLPIRFDPERLAREVTALPSSAWVPHPQGFVGNDAVPLVTVNGGLNDAFEGPMAASEHLLACPYIMALMEQLGGTWGRSRLMGLAPGARVPRHVDIHYYWRTHLRIHIPIITNPGVTFTCGGETVHMAPGESWIFDSFQLHEVHNDGAEKRVHLVLDTVGGERLWDLIEAANDLAEPPPSPWMPHRDTPPRLAYERVNQPRIMSPWEIRCHVDYLSEHVVPSPQLAPVMTRVEKFLSAWQAAWSQYGEANAGRTIYRPLIAATRADLAAMDCGGILLRNEAPLDQALDALIFSRALAHPTSPAATSAEIAEPLIP
ncbi:MAG: aspartyl/asparaginyl beta-hydroxylase domain-containing protein [Sphingomonas bacterium]|nr:aspartyl/asparaginyl beta-hydroxylase domain-containing protein [Sphingomonas bacterium]